MTEQMDGVRWMDKERDGMGWDEKIRTQYVWGGEKDRGRKCIVWKCGGEMKKRKEADQIWRHRAREGNIQKNVVKIQGTDKF